MLSRVDTMARRAAKTIKPLFALATRVLPPIRPFAQERPGIGGVHSSVAPALPRQIIQDNHSRRRFPF